MISDEEIQRLEAMAKALSGSAPVSGGLLERLVNDIRHRGVVGAVLQEHPDGATPLFAVRAMAAAQWLVLAGRAPQFAALLGDALDYQDAPDNRAVDAAWEAMRGTLAAHPDEMAQALGRPVQQHLPRRGAMLLAGLGMLGFSRVRLLELGACAGVNLAVDRFDWRGPGWRWGDPESPLQLTVPTRGPGNVEILSRAGCDLSPKDATNPHDAMILASFIPPEDTESLNELRNALTLAGQADLRIDRADAIEWLHKETSDPDPDPSVCTVIWHSAFWNYLTPQQHDAIEDILNAAAQQAPTARIAYEPPHWAHRMNLNITVYGQHHQP